MLFPALVLLTLAAAAASPAASRHLPALAIWALGCSLLAFVVPGQ